MGLVHWSKTAINNQTADPLAILSEGQPANSLNNAVRGVMAGMAQYRDDQIGTLTAYPSTGTTYSLATNQVIPNLTNPFTLAFMVSATNLAAPKIAVDGLTAVPLRPAKSVEFAAGELAADGTIYRGLFYPGTQEMVLGLQAARVSMVGQFVQQAGSQTPNGCLFCDGSLVSRTTYADLWAFAQLSGNLVTEASWSSQTGKFSSGDLSTNFRIPDMRGYFMRAWDGTRGIDPGRGIGTYQADDNKVHFHVSGNDPNLYLMGGYFQQYAGGAGQTTPITSVYTGNSGGSEARPKNVAYPIFIRY